MAFRTVTATAYSIGKQVQQKPLEDRGIIIAYQLLTAGDGRVRPEHAKNHGAIVSVENMREHNLFVPWDYNCRCIARPISIYEAEQKWGLDSEGKPKVPFTDLSSINVDVARQPGFGQPFNVETLPFAEENTKDERWKREKKKLEDLRFSEITEFVDEKLKAPKIKGLKWK